MTLGTKVSCIVLVPGHGCERTGLLVAYLKMCVNVFYFVLSFFFVLSINI